MPGIPTKFVIADLVFEELRKQGIPPANILQNSDNLPFAYLGVIGASFGDLLSARPEINDSDPNTHYFRAWLPVLRLISGTPAGNGNPERFGIYRDLKQLRDVLNKLNDVIQNEDKFALLGMLDELKSLNDSINDIQALVGSLATLRADIGRAILRGRPSTKVPPSNSWQPRDTLHNSRTGRFLEVLSDLAESSNDERFKAYTLGAIVGYAADLCGNPYINSVTGSPYRNHWWRHRWISNYVDTWVYGYYNSGAATRVQVNQAGIPNPLYTNWPNLCESNLQQRIQLPGISVDGVLQSIRDNQPVPAILPQEFVEFWQKAYQTTYGTLPPGLDKDGLQSAYAMQWLILWLQTSGDVVPCIPPDQINYPDNCGSRPDWVAADGSVVVNGQVVAPPQPERKSNPSIAEIISGIVLAILGILAAATGNILGGVAAIITAVGLIADGATDPDWKNLRCYAGWVSVYLYNLTNALHDLLKWSGFGLPYTQELAHNSIAFQYTGSVTPPDAALNTVRSRLPNPYPASRWAPTTSNWANFPTEPLEVPAQTAYPRDPTWPYHSPFVDSRKSF
jgi:hypothetical protein